MRSANAPEISAGVMIANIPWNMMNARPGVPPSSAPIAPSSGRSRNRWSKPPIRPWWLSPNASE